MLYADDWSQRPVTDHRVRPWGLVDHMHMYRRRMIKVVRRAHRSVCATSGFLDFYMINGVKLPREEMSVAVGPKIALSVPYPSDKRLKKRDCIKSSACHETALATETKERDRGKRPAINDCAVTSCKWCASFIRAKEAQQPLDSHFRSPFRVNTRCRGAAAALRHEENNKFTNSFDQNAL
uniref:Uncharacterized protein n=1 Tax=Steinernema glaseri TaxID=37863 RepID=A0A1I7ZT39_9BILA